MLQVGQFLAELMQMMIVKQSYGAQALAILLPLTPDELFANHVADKLRTVGVLAVLTQLLQLLEQGLFYG